MTWRQILPANGIFSGRDLARSERVQIAVMIGVAAALAAWIAFQKVPDMGARDFTYPWRGAMALLQGANPYDVIKPDGPPPNDHWFMYPITAAIGAVPFTFLPLQPAGALFAGLGSALLVFAITARGGLRSLWFLLTPSYMLAVVLGQWSPVLIAAALLMPLSWALTCKPTIGLPLFLYRPTVMGGVLCAVFLLLGFLVLPSWPLDWWRNTRGLPEHSVPAFRYVGALALIALVRWRRPESRLVAGMALVPQNMFFYDQLPLFLIPGTRGRRVTLLLLSWVAVGLARWQCETPVYCGRESAVWVILLLYLPAAFMALAEPDDVRRWHRAVKAWRIR